MSYKIDFTTFGNVPIGGTNGIPTATTTVTYTSRNIPIVYTRIGNIVTATVGASNINSFAATDGVIGSVPDGYTPVATSVIVCAGYNISVANSQMTCEFALRGNKDVNFSTAGWSGIRAMLGSITYITTDDFPTP